MNVQDFMKKNPPRKKTTAKDRFLALIKGDLEKGIVTLLKNDYSTSEIKSFLESNKIKVSDSILNNYLKEVSEKNKISRQPEQLKK